MAERIQPRGVIDRNEPMHSSVAPCVYGPCVGGIEGRNVRVLGSPISRA